MGLQVWTQMVLKNTQYGELTTCQTSTFMLRGAGEESDTMFISPAYGPSDCPLLATFCWFGMSMDLFQDTTIKLPEVDTTCWGRETMQFEGNGIAPSYVGVRFPFTIRR